MQLETPLYYKGDPVRVYILGPAALATSSQAFSVFLAVWRRGGGPRYRSSPFLVFIISIANLSMTIELWQSLLYNLPRKTRLLSLIITV